MTTTYVCDQPCPADCGHPIVWCEGDDGHERHPICLGCGNDAGECELEDCVGWDLGDCPYFASANRLPGFDPAAVCGHGCYEEPACVTCEPEDGWPSRRVTLLAMAPSGESYMVSDAADRVWSIRPPGAGEPRMVETEMVDIAIAKHGFERVDREFQSWAEADRFRLERATPPSRRQQ